MLYIVLTKTNVTPDSCTESTTTALKRHLHQNQPFLLFLIISPLIYMAFTNNKKVNELLSAAPVTAAVGLVTYGIYTAYRSHQQKKALEAGYKEIPVPKGALPYLGKSFYYFHQLRVNKSKKNLGALIISEETCRYFGLKYIMQIL